MNALNLDENEYDKWKTNELAVKSFYKGIQAFNDCFNSLNQFKSKGFLITRINSIPITWKCKKIYQDNE